MNTGEPELIGLYSAERRVLEIQAKLHRWAGDDEAKRQARRGLWSARCAERCTPGAGGDPGKPTDGNTGRAPRIDLTLFRMEVEDLCLLAVAAVG